MSKTLKGYLMILLSALGFGSYGVWSKLIGNDFEVFTHAWVRSGIVLLLLAPIAYYSGKLQKVSKKDIKRILIPVFFGALTQAPLYFAFNNMDIGTATLIFYASYVITSYVVGKTMFTETIGPVKALSLVLSIVGLLIMFGFSLGKFTLLAMFMAAINGVASGGEVATTKGPTEKYSSLQVSIYIWLGIFLSHLPLAFLLGESMVPFAFNFVWFAMISFAIIGLISFWLVVEGFKYVDASIGGLIGLMEIIFGVMFGIIIFKEALTTTVVVGGLIIMVSAMLPDLVSLYSKNNKE